MEQFEKVVKGLECCILRNPDDEPRCDVCLYEGKCTNRLKIDALSLIQQQAEIIHKLQTKIHELQTAQTARVMTLEELDAIYQTKERHIWPFNTPPWLWMTVNPDVRQTRGFWICWRDIMYSLENDSPFYVRENYGKVWKIWTAEPTDEQIKAVPWE